MTPVDVPVLVVGGGPAGSVTALLLARAGWSVELVDRGRFPRGKACGECLNPAGVRLLRRLDLLEEVLEAGATPMAGWDLALPDRAPAAGRFTRGDTALGVERRGFDATLLEAARRAGVTVREGVRVVGAEIGSVGASAAARLETPGGGERRTCRLLVGADGLHSRVGRTAAIAREVAAPRKASRSWHIEGRGPSRDRGRLTLGGTFTVGLAPVGTRNGARWNATLVVTEPRTSGAPPLEWSVMPDLLDRAVAHSGDGAWERPPEVREGPWGSGSFHRPVERPGAGRLLLVGDAAGYFDPLTGQGIHRALRSAELAAGAVRRHLDHRDGERLEPGDVHASGAYGRELRRSLAPGRWLQRSIEAVVASAGSRRAALTALRCSPALTSSLVRWAGDRPQTMLSGR